MFYGFVGGPRITILILVCRISIFFAVPTAIPLLLYRPALAFLRKVKDFRARCVSTSQGLKYYSAITVIENDGSVHCVQQMI